MVFCCQTEEAVSSKAGPQNLTEEDAATYLRHLHLLHGADHIGCFFAPVTLNDISLYGRAIDGHDGVSCCLVGVEPEK